MSLYGMMALGYRQIHKPKQDCVFMPTGILLPVVELSLFLWSHNPERLQLFPNITPNKKGFKRRKKLRRRDETNKHKHQMPKY